MTDQYPTDGAQPAGQPQTPYTTPPEQVPDWARNGHPLRPDLPEPAPPPQVVTGPEPAPTPVQPVPEPVAQPAPAPSQPAPAPAPVPAPAPSPTPAPPQPEPAPRAAEPARKKAKLNLDVLDRERTTGTAPPEPFDFELNGRYYVLGDPHELDWQITLDVMSNPIRMIQALLPKAEQAEFFKAPLAGWKLNALLDAFMDHYGLPPLNRSAT